MRVTDLTAPALLRSPATASTSIPLPSATGARLRPPAPGRRTLAVGLLVALTGCAGAAATGPAGGPIGPTAFGPGAAAPSPDPRVGLGAGLFDAEEAAWNMRLVSTTPPPPDFVGETNSDLAFTGNLAIQGNYHGILIWDISDPSAPELVRDFVCPASQNDVSVYGNLLFVSAEAMGGRVDCGTQGVPQAVSSDRLRGIRILDISDPTEPRQVTTVQTCRGSHTHTVVEDPADPAHVYIYVSGSAPPRPAQELAGCSQLHPDQDPDSPLFRIEVIRVPLANPELAAIVSSPRIFEGLVAPPVHGPAPTEAAELEAARASGAFILEFPMFDEYMVIPDVQVAQFLAQIVRERGGAGAPTAADSLQLRQELPAIAAAMLGGFDPDSGPDQCHDITAYPALGLAAGACEGYGLLLDITDPVNPHRIDAVYDENFAYWHSASFNNDGTTVLFTDEWGGGGSPRCRATDPPEWGANAIFSVIDGRMEFRSYYKLPAPQTEQENCVAHNGSLVPVPGRDIKVQAWYQGGISVFDFTDPANPFEIAFFDRGPVHPQQMVMGGSWSAYWHNGVIVSSEIARGLDILELVPSPFLTENELEAARQVRFDELNVQAQPRIVWEPTFAVARAYVDQLERLQGLAAARIASVREALDGAEGLSGAPRAEALRALASTLEGEAGASADASRVRLLAETLRGLAG